MKENTYVKFNCCGKWTHCEYIRYSGRKCNIFASLCDGQDCIIRMLIISLATFNHFAYESVTSRTFCPDILLFNNLPKNAVHTRQ